MNWKLSPRCRKSTGNSDRDYTSVMFTDWCCAQCLPWMRQFELNPRTPFNSRSFFFLFVDQEFKISFRKLNDKQHSNGVGLKNQSRKLFRKTRQLQLRPWKNESKTIIFRDSKEDGGKFSKMNVERFNRVRNFAKKKSSVRGT